MTEFWVSSGHHLTRRTEGGGLAVTDELILAYLARPELVPPPEACAAELALHAALLSRPRREVLPTEISSIADPDARENWEVILAFRDRLLGARSVEAAYLSLVRGDLQGVPSLFLDQLVHLILRNALDGCDDPFVLRAAELFFRSQRVSFHEGTALLADAEVIAAREGGMPPSPLVAMFGLEAASELDVMTAENTWTYWSRSDAYTMVLNISSDPRARAGLARVIQTFVRHLLNVHVTVTPLERLEDPDWRWFVGLSQEGTRIGNALWRGEAVDAAMRERLLGVFGLVFDNPAQAMSRVGGHTVYLLLASAADRSLHLKPHNLVVGLPLADGRRAA
ncbi:DUF6352 family protein [Methylobacterium gnaphalii]|uniref:Uncharacterized protein n=1 Tax=Methylobacterium gnaphalii TaxID=1010610 RepID=A0A512JQD7_9HYPH|nr:DUF6352 family protein [Methylobacterium gnaphalii]GEP12180.1 hypothetical protein MGN01_40250 [Methylobacterium gnaphalii]GJD67480.1 hypothetical protein MMMDOFMJ_0395 [Methylobacterium gnaphalii]GLS51302.1 hypothetical protein GCM10007885_41570 [Methylobacterium gnaphalii]